MEDLSAVPGIRRLRLSSLEPRIINPAFAKRLAAIPGLCPHFHLSLQSGSDAVLKRMNRKYGTAEFYEEMCILREAFERPALTTDVIVGFPGETDAEFEETVRFLEKADFYEMHVFRYSRRKGTAADRMPDQVSDAVKAERSARLLAMSEAGRKRFESGLIGESREVLLEERYPRGGKDCFAGRTSEYVRLKLKAPQGSPGSLISVRIAPDMLDP